jgi:WD40 repeat protein
MDDAGHVRLFNPQTGVEIATLVPRGTSFGGFHCLAFSPDGTRVAAGRDHVVYLWDLRLIREALRPMGLDWDGPPDPATTREERDSGPVQITVQAAKGT